MISVEEAISKVLASAKLVEVEEVPLPEAIGRVLAADVIADRDFPPFDRVTMDGIAILHAGYEKGQREYKVEHVVAAGSPQYTLQNPANCIEIMTGAILPLGVDTVIRYEDMEKKADGFHILAEIPAGKNVHKKGSDHKRGDVLLHVGHSIYPIDINILASVGQRLVSVFRYPKIAVISTGDELIPVDEIPLAHQIRRSNSFMLQSALRKKGVESDSFHLADNEELMYSELKKILQEYDVILMSGGVSKGAFDYIPSVLNKLGVQEIFHRIAQRPGKPFWFGADENTTVFAFPGNPVSTLVCFYRYFIPWLKHAIGKNQQELIRVRLKHDVDFRPNLSYFAQAKVGYTDEGICEGELIRGNGSGDMVSPSLAHGFIEFPAGKDQYKKGEVYDFFPY